MSRFKLMEECMEIKKLFFLSVAIFGSSIATANPTLTLVNHYDKPLTFAGRQNAKEVLPEFPAEFTVAQNNSKASPVVDIQKHAYMKVIDGEKHSGFFGVEVVNEKTKVHGYLSKGIAYSWKTDVVTFCTPADYKRNGFCT